MPIIIINDDELNVCRELGVSNVRDCFTSLSRLYRFFKSIHGDAVKAIIQLLNAGLEKYAYTLIQNQNVNVTISSEDIVREVKQLLENHLQNIEKILEEKLEQARQASTARLERQISLEATEKIEVPAEAPEYVKNNPWISIIMRKKQE